MTTNSSLTQLNETGNKEPNVPITSQAIVIVIGILSVVFNGLLLVVMTLNSKQVFASLGSFFIANLAIADFITGLNAIGWGIQGLLDIIEGPLQTFLLRTFWITVQVSFYTIFVMSTERLIAVVFPFKAALIMSKMKTILYCVIVWVVAIVIATSSVNENHHRIDTVWFGVIVFFEVLILIIVFEYIFVFRQLRALWLQSKTRVVYTHNSDAVTCKSSRRTTDIQREYQATIVVICLVIILVVTVFPYNIATQVYLSCNVFRDSCTEQLQREASDFMWYYFIIELLNFVVNPVVYAWRLPKYRNAFLKTFGLNKRKGTTLLAKTEATVVSSNGRNLLPS